MLEEAHIKLSSLVSDLLGVSARRMLKALADGETNPAALAALADQRLRATPAQLRDALGACTELNPVYRRLLKMALEELQLIDAADRPAGPGDGESAQPASRRRPATGGSARSGSGFSTADHRRSRSHRSDLSLGQISVLLGGRMPGDEESAGVNYSHRSPKGNRHMRRVLNQAANAAVKAKGSIFEIVYRRYGPAPGTQSSHRSDCPSTVSADLVDPASASPLRRTRPSRHQTIEAKAHCENDPATP